MFFDFFSRASFPHASFSHASFPQQCLPLSPSPSSSHSPRSVPKLVDGVSHLHLDGRSGGGLECQGTPCPRCACTTAVFGSNAAALSDPGHSTGGVGTRRGPGGHGRPIVCLGSHFWILHSHGDGNGPGAKNRGGSAGATGHLSLAPNEIGCTTCDFK